MLRSLTIVPALGCVLAGLLAGPVAAQDHPEFHPTRPVVVTYELTGSNQTGGASKVQLSFAADPDRVRMDLYSSAGSAEPFGSLIFDKPRNRVITLIPARKAYLQRDAVGLANPGLMLSPNLQYTRAGTEQFAGLSCTDWTVRNKAQADVAGTVCVTNDGVTLKAERGPPDPGTMRAIGIEYKTPPDSAFEVPAGYTLMKSKTPGG